MVGTETNHNTGASGAGAPQPIAGPNNMSAPKQAPTGVSSDLLSEACSNPEFERFVHGGADPTALKWATLCLGLIGAKGAGLEERSALYEAIMHAPRPDLLCLLVGTPIPRSVISLLLLPATPSLDGASIVGLAAAAADVKTRRALSQLDHATEVLARQIGRVPVHLRSSRLLRVLNDLKLSESFWSELLSATAKLERDARTNTEARVRRAGTVVELFAIAADVFEQPFLQKPYYAEGADFRDPRLTLLDRPAALIAEAERMKNCLRDRWPFPYEGGIAYAAWHGDESASVELRRGSRRWEVAFAKGIKNAALSSSTRAQIEAAVAQSMPDERASIPEQDDALAYIAAQADWARTEFQRHSFEGIHDALQKLQDAKVLPEAEDRPFYIFESADPEGVSRYVQFLADDWGDRRVLLCEIGSHKTQPGIAKYLDEGAFRFIRSSGFKWPQGEANFSRWFVPGATVSLAQLAYFSLATLGRIFRVSPRSLIWMSNDGASWSAWSEARRHQ